MCIQLLKLHFLVFHGHHLSVTFTNDICSESSANNHHSFILKTSLNNVISSNLNMAPMSSSEDETGVKLIIIIIIMIINMI